MNQKIFYIVLLLFIVACQSKPKFDVDLSNVKEVDVKIKRYEKALFAVKPDSIRVGLNALKSQFNFFIGDKIDTFGILSLYNYITDSNVIRTFKDTRGKYPELKSLEKE